MIIYVGPSYTIPTPKQLALLYAYAEKAYYVDGGQARAFEIADSRLPELLAAADAATELSGDR